LTHALSGALLARATAPKDLPPRSLPRRIAAGFFACAAPDLDFVFSAFGPVAYLELHRGPTHSLLLLPFWALIFSWVLAKILREPRGWRALYGVTAMGLALHIAGDLITSYGTMILWPVSDMRPGLGSTFIIDLWFSGHHRCGLLFSIFYRTSRIPSIAAAFALVGYVFFQTLQKEKALEFGREYAARPQHRRRKGRRASARGFAWNWTVFVSDERAHHFAHVNLVRGKTADLRRRRRLRREAGCGFPAAALARWETRSRYGADGVAKDAWESPPFAFMRWFALSRPSRAGPRIPPATGSWICAS
jgi:inner membrane protein